MTIMDLAEKVKKGDFPEVGIPAQERVTVMDMQLLANYSLIIGSCLLNGIPEENAEMVYEKRRDLYDSIMETVNKRNFGRTLRLNVELSEIVNKATMDESMWPSKNERNNVLLFVVQYFLWDDKTRAIFFGANPEEVNATDNEAVEPEKAEAEAE